MEEIARLEPGQAYYYSEGLYAPRQIVGLNAYDYLGLKKKETSGNHELSLAIKKDDWFVESKKERNAYVVDFLSEQYENLVQTINKTSNDLKIYANDFERINKVTDIEDKDVQLTNLRSDVIETRNDIKILYAVFVNFVKSLPQDIINNLREPDIIKYRNLINGPIQKMSNQASVLDIELENLRSKITNLLLKGRIQYGTERD